MRVGARLAKLAGVPALALTASAYLGSPAFAERQATATVTRGRHKRLRHRPGHRYLRPPPCRCSTPLFDTGHAAGVAGSGPSNLLPRV